MSNHVMKMFLITSFLAGGVGTTHAIQLPGQAKFSVQRPVTLQVGPKTQQVRSSYNRLMRETLTDGTAANFEIVPYYGIREKVTQEEDYDAHKKRLAKVTGLGASGLFRSTFLGTVSAHDFGDNISDAALKQAVLNRVAGDGLRVSLRYNGDPLTERVIATAPSQVVTQLEIAPEFKPGLNEIIYDRTNRAGTQVVGDRDLNAEGRILQYYWDGK